MTRRSEKQPVAPLWWVLTLISAVLTPSDIHNLHYLRVPAGLGSVVWDSRGAGEEKDSGHSCFLADKNQWLYWSLSCA